jgi:hypothetical protein
VEGSEETSRRSSKKCVETKMVSNTDVHLEGSKERNGSPSKKDVKTKEALSSDIQLRDSQEPSRSPNKKEVETKEVLNMHVDTYLKDRKETGRISKKRVPQQKKIRAEIPTWKTLKKQLETQNHKEIAQN